MHKDKCFLNWVTILNELCSIGTNTIIIYQNSYGKINTRRLFLTLLESVTLVCVKERYTNFINEPKIYVNTMKRNICQKIR